MPLRAVVADDEPLGRRGIVARLAGSSDVSVVAQCRNGREAIEAVTAHRPDLLFLDVQMPGLDGFDVVDALPAEGRPHVIFVTAYDRHAVRAFEVRALDYLVKPIDDARFEDALRRAAAAIRQHRDGAPARRRGGDETAGEAGASPAPRAGPPALANCWPVRERGKVHFVRHSEIDRVEAEGDYVRLHVASRSWLVRETMSAAERRLGGRRFLRIHRSKIVNADRIRELRSLDNGDCTVVMQDGAELRLSRTYRDALTRLIGGR